MTTSGLRDCGCDLVLEEGIEIIEGRTRDVGVALAEARTGAQNS